MVMRSHYATSLSCKHTQIKPSLLSFEKHNVSLCSNRKLLHPRLCRFLSDFYSRFVRFRANRCGLNGSTKSKVALFFDHALTLRVGEFWWPLRPPLAPGEILFSSGWNFAEGFRSTVIPCASRLTSFAAFSSFNFSPFLSTRHTPFPWCKSVTSIKTTRYDDRVIVLLRLINAQITWKYGQQISLTFRDEIARCFRRHENCLR